jgi:hypothetical protein
MKKEIKALKPKGYFKEAAPQDTPHRAADKKVVKGFYE